jgi:flagellar motor switch protein FliN/FliY
MFLAQEDIDAVLRSAEAAVNELAGETAMPGMPAPVKTAAASRRAAPIGAGAPESVQRILRLTVPLIVRLASRRMRVSEIIRWGRGAIIEFEKPVSAYLDLMVNNICVGEGEAVKVGENFGLRLTHVCDRTTRANSLGPRAESSGDA